MTGGDLARAVVAVQRGNTPPWIACGRPVREWAALIPVADCRDRIDEVEKAYGDLVAQGRNVASGYLSDLLDALELRLEA